MKDAKAPVKYNNQSVKSGGRLSLIRWPEDRAVDPKEHEKDKPDSKEKHRDKRNRKGGSGNL